MDGSVKRHLSLSQEFTLQLAALGLWLAGFGAAALLEYAPNASLWFPPAAVTFAAVLVLGYRVFPILWVGCLVVTFLADQVFERGQSWSELLLAGCIFALTHTIVYGVAAQLLLRVARSTERRLLKTDVIRFLILTAIAAAASSVLAAWSLSLTGQAQTADLIPLIKAWFIGDYAGLVTVTPLVAVLLSHLAARVKAPTDARLDRLAGLNLLELAWTRAMTRLSVVLILGLALVSLPLLANQPLLFFGLALMIPALAWLARTEPALTTALGVFLVTLLVAIAVSATASREVAVELQFFVITLAAVSYLAISSDQSVTLRDKAIF